MYFEDLHTYLMGFPGVEESFPFDETTLVYKVEGKIFALTHTTTFERINLKCDPEWAIALRETYEEVMPGYHMNKKHWNTLNLAGGLTLSLVKTLIDHSYLLVVAGLARHRQQALQAMEGYSDPLEVKRFGIG